MLKITSGILEEIGESHKSDLGFIDRLVLVKHGKGGDFIIDENGVICSRDRVSDTDMRFT